MRLCHATQEVSPPLASSPTLGDKDVRSPRLKHKPLMSRSARRRTMGTVIRTIRTVIRTIRTVIRNIRTLIRNFRTLSLIIGAPILGIRARFPIGALMVCVRVRIVRVRVRIMGVCVHDQGRRPP